MLSVVLTLAMTTAPEVPSGLFLARGGCSGRAVSLESVRVHARAVIASRPHFLAGVVAWVQTHRPHLAAAVLTPRAGCGGGSTFSKSVTRSVTRQTGAPVVGQATMPDMQPPAVAFGERIERAAVHRQLRIALHRGTPEQHAIAAKLLADPEAYDAAVSAATKILKKQLGMQGGPNVGKFGDGTILKMIIDNLDKIMPIVLEILKAFGL